MERQTAKAATPTHIIDANTLANIGEHIDDNHARDHRPSAHG